MNNIFPATPRLIFTQPSKLPSYMKAICIIGIAAALALWGVW